MTLGQTMKARVSWDQDLTFTGTTDSGYKTVMDGSGKAVSQWSQCCWQLVHVQVLTW